MEIALPYRGNAFRVVHAVQIGEDLWVVHAFQKKPQWVRVRCALTPEGRHLGPP